MLDTCYITLEDNTQLKVKVLYSIIEVEWHNPDYDFKQIDNVIGDLPGNFEEQKDEYYNEILNQL